MNGAEKTAAYSNGRPQLRVKLRAVALRLIEPTWAVTCTAITHYPSISVRGVQGRWGRGWAGQPDPSRASQSHTLGLFSLCDTQVLTDDQQTPLQGSMELHFVGERCLSQLFGNRPCGFPCWERTRRGCAMVATYLLALIQILAS